MNNKLFVLAALMVLLACPVFADKLILAQEAGALDLVFPQIAFIKANSDYTFNTHVYNVTGRLLSNSATSCYLHVYNHSGVHTVSTNMSYDSEDSEFYYLVNKNNFSKIGFYSYIIQCNSSSYGGSVSGNFEVTRTGDTTFPTDTSSGLAVMLFLLSVTGLFLWFALSKYRIVGEDIANFIIKNCFLILAVFFTILNTAILSTIVEKANLGVTKEIFTYTWLFGWAGYILIIYLLFSTTFKVMKLWNLKKKEKRTGIYDQD